MPSREDELGGLWEKQTRNGQTFMSGKLKLGDTEVEVVIFHNDHKKPGEKTPDWRVYRSQPRDGQQQPPPTRSVYQDALPNVSERPAPSPRPAPARQQRPQYDDELSDDIPF